MITAYSAAAWTGLITFATALLAAVFVLVPGQGRVALGVELAVAGVVIGVSLLVIDIRAGQSDQETAMTRALSRIFPSVAGCGCLTVAGGSLLADGGGGLYWLVPTFAIVIISGMLNAWILLVEIMR